MNEITKGKGKMIAILITSGRLGYRIMIEASMCNYLLSSNYSRVFFSPAVGLRGDASTLMVLQHCVCVFEIRVAFQFVTS